MDMRDIQSWAKRAGGQQDDDSGEPSPGDEGGAPEPMDLDEAETKLKEVLDGLKAHGADGPDLSKVTDELQEVLDFLDEAKGEAADAKDDEGDDEGDDDSGGNPFGDGGE